MKNYKALQQINMNRSDPKAVIPVDIQATNSCDTGMVPVQYMVHTATILLQYRGDTSSFTLWNGHEN